MISFTDIEAFDLMMCFFECSLYLLVVIFYAIAIFSCYVKRLVSWFYYHPHLDYTSLHSFFTQYVNFVLTFYCDLFYTINKMRRHPLQLAILLLATVAIHSQFSKCPVANPLQIASGTSFQHIRLDYGLETGTGRHRQWSRYTMLQLYARHTVHLHARSRNR